jgi:HK97 family phage portal protein
MFLSGIKAEDRSPFGSFWFEPVGVRTGSGIRVTADTAMTLSSVFRAVSLVSGHMALVPIRFYKKGTRKQITKHRVLDLLNKRPNRFQNAFEWREMVQGHLELRGNAYNEILANSKGEIEELIPRHPDRVRVEVMANGDYRYRITDIDGTTRTVPRGKMWHIRGLSSDGIVGLSVIEYARESMGLGIAAKSYGAKFFANDAKPTSGWLEFPGTYKDKAQKESVRASLQDAQSSMNRGKLMLLDYGMKYHEVGATNEDMQFIETQRFSVEDVARWFGVPPHKIGALERATNNNIEQQALEYVTDALMTRASRNTAAIVADLLFDDEEIEVEYDFSVFLRGDSVALSNYIKTLVVNGIITRNEGRAILGYDPLEGLDRPLLPLNMVEEPQDGEDTRGQQEGKPATKVSDLAAASRLIKLIKMGATRIARRVVKAGKLPDADVVAETLAISTERAAQWIADQPTEEFDETRLSKSLIEIADEICL